MVSRGSDGNLSDTRFISNVGDLGGAARVEGNRSCVSVEEPIPWVDQAARYAGGVYAVLGAGRASFDGCTVEGTTVDPGAAEVARDAPDLVVAADSLATTPASHYRITGKRWFCELATGCYGDVEE